MENVGKHIKMLREKEHVMKSKLCDGLCTVQNLSLIEDGEGLADMLLLVGLLERLGKSAERLTFILTAEEYQRLEKRDQIEEALRFGEVSKAKEMFWEYQKKNPPCKNRILSMYEEKILGILALEEYGQGGAARKEAAAGEEDYAAEQENENPQKRLEDAAAHFMKAVEWTLSFQSLFNGELIQKLDAGKKLLAMFEIENILLYLDVQRLLGKGEGQLALLEALHRYLRKDVWDNELRSQYLAKVGILLGGQYLEQGDYGACIKMHEEILQLSRECGIIVSVLPVLEQIIKAYTKQREPERAEFYTIHKENLEAIFQEFHLSPDCMNKLYYSCRMRQYFIEGEIIAAERKWKGILQEELVDGIYKNVENLSRVETGKANSERKKFYQLMQRLGVDKTRYNGNLITDEYQVLELDWEIERHLARKQYDEVTRELCILEECVDMEEKCNRQLVWGMKNKEMYRRREVGIKEGIERARELLELTYHLDNTENGGERYRRIPFRNEMYMFNQICIFLRIDGRIEEAIAMMERMMRTYEAVKEDRKFHFKNVHLCGTNLCHYLVKVGRLEEAEEIADTLIQEDLICGKISLMHRLFATRSDVLMKKNQAIDKAEKLQRAYLLSEWGSYKKDYEIIKKTLKKLR